MSMLQIMLIMLGLVLVLSLLVQAGDRSSIGLLVCGSGFILELIASIRKARFLAA